MNNNNDNNNNFQQNSTPNIPQQNTQSGGTDPNVPQQNVQSGGFNPNQSYAGNTFNPNQGYSSQPVGDFQQGTYNSQPQNNGGQDYYNNQPQNGFNPQPQVMVPDPNASKAQTAMIVGVASLAAAVLGIVLFWVSCACSTGRSGASCRRKYRYWGQPSYKTAARYPTRR